jgi:hypothetical protein
MGAAQVNPALQSTNRGFAPPVAGTPRRLRAAFSLDFAASIAGEAGVTTCCAMRSIATWHCWA